MKRRMKAFGLAAALLVLTILLPACGKGADAPSRFTLFGPAGEIDAVPATVRAYLTRAEEKYARFDVAESAKEDFEIFTELASVTFEWSVEAPAEGASYEILLSTEEGFADPEIISCASVKDGRDKETVYNLKTGTTYFWKVREKKTDGGTEESPVSSFRTKEGPRILFVLGVQNCRDLGGWKTADGKTVVQGRVYRSGSLDKAESAGKQTLTEELGIRTVIDFRNPEKEAVKTVLQGPDVKTVNLPAKSYRSFIESPEDAYQIFKIFADPNAYPILFHCEAGADRTGSVAFLLNALAGCGYDQLAMDYELTYQRYVKGTYTDEHTYDFPGLYQAFLALQGETPVEKAKTFLRATGLTDAEIETIRRMLTEE